MSEFPIPLPGATAETLMWARPEEVEHQAMQQLRNISTVPWVHGIRVMPDVHLGKGATVGSVIAMKQAVSPAAVGVDIGCGVVATRTNLRLEDVERLPALRAAIESLIPVGHLGHARTVNVRALGLEKGWAPFWNQFKNLHSDAAALESRAASQMGTLGGGNHFIELCVDDDNFLWLTLHSGSRNIGKSLAERHIDIARGLSHNQDLVDRDLAVFLAGSPEMVSYRHDLMWAQEYALRSRGVMMALFKNALVEHYPSKAIVFDDDINVHHNYVAEEMIDGELMLVTRKGAIRAGLGDLALIPGSMGTGSFVVRGLGNDASFQSASHGAGRRLSRSAAKREFMGDDEGATQIALQLGDIESRRDSGIVDELPNSYKNIDDVIANQADLVEVVQRLRTLLCVKG